ncbi:unnamed protein product [Amoebophrya sp. A25]|nr:unnamed protein product [Amoebophrya sp. A25]|eukprot:GSA25T00016339001.1
MPIGSGASNKAQRGVVEKKAKSGGGCELDEDKAFKAKQAAEKKALAAAAAGIKGKKK